MVVSVDSMMGSVLSSTILPSLARKESSWNTLLANIQVELVGIMPGMFLVPSMVTPCLTTTSPASVSSQLPPWSMEMSMMLEPGAIEATMSAVIRMGASLPGIRAHRMMMSESFTRGFRASRSLCSHSSLRRWA